jgi:membrane-associated progesterone receptor component
MSGKRFEPKEPVHLDLPKDDPITVEELSKCDGMGYL